MKKVINATISGWPFIIEEDAFQLLSEYLEALGKHFQNQDSESEIVEDIELAVAEKFKKIISAKKKIVDKKDVERAISELGKVEDFEFKKVEFEQNNTKVKPKLYRDADDKIIAGVAAGVAIYFNLETALVRALFLVSVFFGGLGLALYIVLWLVVPEARTPSEKLAMRGQRITLVDLEQKLKKGVQKIKKKIQN